MSRREEDWRWEGERGKVGEVKADTFAAHKLQWTLIAIHELAKSGPAALDFWEGDLQEALDHAAAMLHAIEYLADSPEVFLYLPLDEVIDEYRERTKAEGEKLLKEAGA